MTSTFADIKYLLDDRVNQYNHPDFIDTDPIQIPHRFSRKEDIEIAGFRRQPLPGGNGKALSATPTSC